MNVSLPYSRNKRYLTGMDWLIAGLNDMTTRSTSGGIRSQVALELDSKPDTAALKDILSETVSDFPELSGKISRDINLAPYWKINTAAPAPVPSVSVHEQNTDRHITGNTFTSLSRAVNKDSHLNDNSLCFHVFSQEKSSQHYLSMTFDHTLFDALGAEAFLAVLNKRFAAPENDIIRPPLSEPAHLDNWTKKFQAGRRINRFFRAMMKDGTACIPLPQATRVRKFHFKHSVFEQDESKRIFDNACRHAGYFMLTPYILSAVAKAFHELNVAGQNKNDSYIVPVSIDARPGNNAANTLFFNNLSFMYFHIRPDNIAGIGPLTQLMTRRMYEIKRSGLSEDLADASMLMRILPLPLIGRLMRTLRPLLGSFSFSFLNGSGSGLSDFMGTRVLNLFHMPRVPAPPGAGFFFNMHDSKLNMVVSFIDGLIDESTTDKLEGRIRELLLEG